MEKNTTQIYRRVAACSPHERITNTDIQIKHIRRVNEYFHTIKESQTQTYVHPMKKSQTEMYK
jgi:hypothetical protein